MFAETHLWTNGVSACFAKAGSFFRQRVRWQTHTLTLTHTHTLVSGGRRLRL